jgi:hypothetical protein
MKPTTRLDDFELALGYERKAPASLAGFHGAGCARPTPK